MSQGIEILCDSHHGVYIPQLMINRLIDNGWQGIEKGDVKELQDPWADCYWDVWGKVEICAFFIDENGNKWQLWHDGDLFAFCDDLMTEEEKENFFGKF